MEADPKLCRFQFGTLQLGSTKPRARRTLMSRWGSADFAWHKEKGIFL